MDKREARKEFKARIIPKGVFALRCMGSKDVWVSGSDHLNSEQNGLWFMLRGGLHFTTRTCRAPGTPTGSRRSCLKLLKGWMTTSRHWCAKIF